MRHSVVAAPVLRAHDRSCYLSCNHTTRRIAGRATIVRLCKTCVRTEIAATDFFEHAQKPVFDRETVHDHHDNLRDLSAISCDLAVRLVVRIGRNLVARPV